MTAPTTARVSVPVEPTGAMLDAAFETMSRAEADGIYQAPRDVWSAMLAAAPAAPQAAGVGKRTHPTGEAIQDALIAGFLHGVGRDPWDDMHDYIAVCARDYVNGDPLPARAPSREPEGGAVWREYRRLLEGKVEQWTASDYLGDDRLEVDDALELACAIKAILNALTTREEAPAEAGEIGAEYDDAAHCVTLAACPPGLFLWNGTLGFKSEYGAMEPVGISPHHQQWKVGNRVDAYCADSGEYFWGGTSNHDDRAKLLVYPISAEAVAMVASHGPSAIRAQPQAREEAQPVAGLTVHLVSDGGDIHRIRKWENHGLREGTHRLYTTPPAPEAEKLRVAVEALEKIKLQRDVGLGTQSIAVEALQALAALQQEGW